MTLAESLSFIKKENYFIMSLIIGFIIDIIPAIGALGPLTGGFLYSYFSIYFGDIPKDQIESIKRGGMKGLIVAIIGIIIDIFTWSMIVPMPAVYSSFILLNAIVIGLVVGAIIGAVGGFIALYIK